MEQTFKDILDRSMSSHGWPDKQLTDDEVFDLEFGTASTAPKPAIRKSVPILDTEIAKMISESLVKAVKK